MINKLKLIRNISQFDSVSPLDDVSFSKLNLVYAENGRGKTTLTAILKSSKTGDSKLITERHRITATHPPAVIIETSSGTLQFQNESWSSKLSEMEVFDDAFINDNIYSGLSVDATHRQNLHELIIGAEGLKLNQQLNAAVKKIEIHNQNLIAKSNAIPAEERLGFTIDEFLKLPKQSNIVEIILESERNLDAVRQQTKIIQTPQLSSINLPSFDLNQIKSLLVKDLPGLEQSTMEKLQSHFALLGNRGEEWVSEGVDKITDDLKNNCPFCMQNLDGSELIKHYQAYFSEQYSSLCREIDTQISDINRIHDGNAKAAFERSIGVLNERATFWRQFVNLESENVDTIEMATVWRKSYENLLDCLNRKKAKPFDKIALTEEENASIDNFIVARTKLAAQIELLINANKEIQIIKEKAAAGNIQAIERDLKIQKATKFRYGTTTAEACEVYLEEKNSKKQTEDLRDDLKAKLAEYQATVFPNFNVSINKYLAKFNAGFRLDSMISVNTRGGTSCTYNLIICNKPVPVDGSAGDPGQRSFKNTLSSGDRNTLALAFFFAALEQDPNLANKIIVIDDPITSLDDGRSLTTAQEIRELANKAKQVIVLSHSKPFLCQVWQSADASGTAIEVIREGTDGSSISRWDVNRDSLTEYDHNHQLIREYLNAGTEKKETARSLRPTLEGFLRIAYPKYFPPRTLLGSFINVCKQRLNTNEEILSNVHVQELDQLNEYASKFHHDTNPAWQTETINDTQLNGFVERVLMFVRK